MNGDTLDWLSRLPKRPRKSPVLDSGLIKVLGCRSSLRVRTTTMYVLTCITSQFLSLNIFLIPSCMVLRPHGSVSSPATPRTRGLSSPCSTPQADGVDPISHPPSLNSFPVLRKNITSALSSKHSATPAKYPVLSMSSAPSAPPASHRHYPPPNRS